MVAEFACLLTHEIGDTTARDAAIDWLGKTISDFPTDPTNASHQLERCLAVAIYYRLSVSVGCARKVDDVKLIRYLAFAQQLEWFGDARIAMEVALLSAELTMAVDAQSYLRAHLRKWRLAYDWSSVMQAYVGLGARLTAQEAEGLLQDSEQFEPSEERQFEAVGLALLALKGLKAESAEHVMVKLADKILATLDAKESSLRAAADLQALLYLASAPIPESQFRDCVDAITQASGSPVLRRTTASDGKVMIDFAAVPTVPQDLGYFGLEELALAAYALTLCGFGSVVGVSLRESARLKLAVQLSEGIGNSQVVPIWEMRILNLVMLVFSVLAAIAWVFWISGGTLAPKPDWTTVLQGAAIPAALLLLAGILGWRFYGRALTGLVAYLYDMVGHRLEENRTAVPKERND